MLALSFSGTSHMFVVKGVQRGVTGTKRGNRLFHFSICSMIPAVHNYFQRLEIFGVSSGYVA